MTPPRAARQTPVFRLIDFAEALSGPDALPRLESGDIERWAGYVLPWLQQWVLSRAYGLPLGPPRSERPAMNAPITLGEVAEAVGVAFEPIGDMLGELKRGRNGADIAVKLLYTGTIARVIRELERRHGARGRPVDTTLH